MKLPDNVCEVLRDHVVLESECIDRMYLNVYVPQLQRIGGVVWYLRGHLGQRFASTAGVAPKTDAFVAHIERFVAEQGVEMVSFTIFFEQVVRENLDIGRPGQVQLIFDRRVNRRTPGRLRTRVITEGVTPSLHVDYKRSRIKQYHKEGQALRTETSTTRATSAWGGC